MKFFAMLLVALVVLLATTSCYMCGRIILPEMGLTPPEYWTWFWFSAIGTVFGVAIASIGEFIKEMLR